MTKTIENQPAENLYNGFTKKQLEKLCKLDNPNFIQNTFKAYSKLDFEQLQKLGATSVGNARRTNNVLYANWHTDQTKLALGRNEGPTTVQYAPTGLLETAQWWDAGTPTISENSPNSVTYYSTGDPKKLEWHALAQQKKVGSSEHLLENVLSRLTGPAKIVFSPDQEILHEEWFFKGYRRLGTLAHYCQEVGSVEAFLELAPFLENYDHKAVAKFLNEFTGKLLEDSEQPPSPAQVFKMTEIFPQLTSELTLQGYSDPLFDQKNFKKPTSQFKLNVSKKTLQKHRRQQH